MLFIAINFHFITHQFKLDKKLPITENIKN